MAGELTPDQVMASVERHMGGVFEWGPADCCSAPCAVFANLWSIQPMQGLTYAGARGASCLIRRHGGMWAFSHHLADRAGLRQATGLGAIGLIRTQRGLSLAIQLGAGIWAAKAAAGFTTISQAEVSWLP
ncbi:DUF6950 family protein [Thioclava sp. GXIMD4215]|uniref:DUF6950 family protein n=1 Tax=Thioclava sp. GXIMD4215 TaxID=3131928 RepID=UPI003255CDBE